MSLNLFSYGDDTSDEDSRQSMDEDNLQETSKKRERNENYSQQETDHQDKRIQLPPFNLDSIPSTQEAGSVKQRAGAIEKRSLIENKGDTKTQTKRKWSMKPSQLTRQVYSTEDLGND